MTRRISKDNVHSPGKVAKTLKAMQVEIEALIAHTNAVQTALNMASAITTPVMAVGGTTTNVGWSSFDYIIGGVVYKAAAGSGAITAATLGSGAYGAVALDVASDLAVDRTSSIYNSGSVATTSGGALSGIPAVDSGHVRVALMTIRRTASSGGSGVTFATTALDDSGITTSFKCLDNRMSLLASTVLSSVSDTVISPN